MTGVGIHFEWEGTSEEIACARKFPGQERASHKESLGTDSQKRERNVQDTVM